METNTPSKVKIRQVGQIAIPITDLERAITFYRDVLGMKYLFQAPPGLGFFDCNGVRLMLDLPAKDYAGKGTAIYYGVDNLQSAFESLSQQGVEVVQGPHFVAKLRDHDLWMAFFRDTETNMFALMEERR